MLLVSDMSVWVKKGAAYAVPFVNYIELLLQERSEWARKLQDT